LGAVEKSRPDKSGRQPAGARSFGVRQLAAAFLPASWLAAFRTRAQFPASKLAGRKAAACCRFPPRELARGISNARTIPRQQAGWRQSGSKLPHSKGSLRLPTEKRFSAARPELSGQALPNPW